MILQKQQNSLVAGLRANTEQVQQQEHIEEKGKETVKEEEIETKVNFYIIYYIILKNYNTIFIFFIYYFY